MIEYFINDYYFHMITIVVYADCTEQAMCMYLSNSRIIYILFFTFFLCDCLKNHLSNDKSSNSSIKS